MKCFEYVRTMQMSVCSEKDVQKSIDELPPDSPSRENGAKILALAIGESIAFPSGTSFKRIEDDSQRLGHVAILCTRGRRTTRCKYCGQPSTKLCDFKVARKATCDTPLCDRCATSGGSNIDYCRPHAKLVQQGAAAR